MGDYFGIIATILMNYSQSTEVLNDFIRWSRNSEVRKRRLKKTSLKDQIRIMLQVGIEVERFASQVRETTNMIKLYNEAYKILKQQ